ncbi:MAG TPA: hypothetical protein VJS37_13870, partial [Terriglobales bacterium]|nr:hypothetical protein [Terriglobales bacterium]
MHRKSLFLVGSLASVLVIGGYFALRKVPPPVATQKQAEVTLESTASGIFSELARSGDGRLLAIVKDGKEIGTWDRLQGGPTVRLFESDEKEWLYSPTFSPDGSVLATISNTPKQQNAGHLLLWDSATGQRLASVDDISWPVCCASFNPVG